MSRDPLQEPAEPIEKDMTMSDQTEIERLRAEVAVLKQASQKPLTFKVSPKGVLSVYGLQRFPVSLYREQWERLLEAHEQIRAFIAANEATLKVKGAP